MKDKEYRERRERKMKRMLIVIMFVLIAGQGIITTGASAAEQASKAAVIGMKEQHQIMQTLGAQWSKAKQALVKKDFHTAHRAVQKMVDVAPNIENLQPHRNPEKREEFIEYSKAFTRSLTQLKRAVFAEDAAASAELVKEIDNTCNQCHTVFGGGHQHSH
jgi:hypothetical protein